MPPHGRGKPRKGGRGGASAKELSELLRYLPLLRTGKLDALKQQAEHSLQQQQPSRAQPQQPKPQQKQQKEEDGWQDVSRKKKKKVESAGVQSAAETATTASEEVSLAEGQFSAPPVVTVAEMREGVPGICLAKTQAEAKKALAEIKSTKPLAILSPKQLDSSSVQMQVKVKKDGKTLAWMRWLTQLGTGEVSLVNAKGSLAQKAAGEGEKKVAAGTKRVVLTAHQAHMTASNWKALSHNPIATARTWLLQRAEAKEVVEVAPPTRVSGKEGQTQMVALVDEGSWEKVQRACGKDGVVVREFLDAATSKYSFKVVPLPKEQVSLESARRSGATFGDKVWGAVPMRIGVGLRVRPENFEEVLRAVQGEDAVKFLGRRFRVKGVPLLWGKDALLGYLAENGWQAEVLGFPTRTGFRRTWTVKAAAAPPLDILEYADDTWLQIQALEETEKKPATAVKLQKWQPQARATAPAEGPKPSWAQVATGGSKRKAAGQQEEVPAVPVEKEEEVAAPPVASLAPGARGKGGSKGKGGAAQETDENVQLAFAQIASLQTAVEQMTASLVAMQRAMEKKSKKKKKRCRSEGLVSSSDSDKEGEARSVASQVRRPPVPPGLPQRRAPSAERADGRAARSPRRQIQG